MNNRQRIMAALNYQPYDRLPILHFGFWGETLQKWIDEGHLKAEEAQGWGDGNPVDAVLSAKLGFDSNYYSAFHPNTGLIPTFETRIVKEFADGTQHVMNFYGVVELHSPGAGSIPAEIDHLFKGRMEWEDLYLPKLQFDTDRVMKSQMRVNDTTMQFDKGGMEFLQKDDRDYMYGIHCGSLYGTIRNYIGIENLCYLVADDEELLEEVINVNAELCYQAVKTTLETGAKFDFGHFWEDICYKNGPLVTPSFFMEKVGPHYKRITDLLKSYDINIVSLDCDGMIDALIPTWFENGVNTMFPIEVGTWDANIAPWRAKYGKELRGVGGMNKVVFAHDRAAIDAEIERLRPLIELGGFIPCPDHRIAPDAEFDNVRYYCDRLRDMF
ncbi:MAG: uroporphyrinogen decarboxylase family protein [bacterium]